VSSADSTRRRLVSIVGPTAVGKSALALYLARRFDGEIVNADSRQVYRYMDIGTAKPSQEERRQVPHHLLDILDPDQEFSLQLFLKLAREAIDDIHSRNKLPLLVGGTGQYVWGLLEGWSPPGAAPDPELRTRLQSMGADSLFRELERVDPASAAGIGPHNVRRLVRALEVYHQTGVPFSRAKRKDSPEYDSLMLGLTVPRLELYERIDNRIDIMMDSEWIEEVKALLERGYTQDLPSMSSVGYAELAAHLRGQILLQEAVQKAKHRTHRFARHQYAWFRLRDPRIRWLDSTPGAAMMAEGLVRAFLGT